ncbi:MAG: nucleotidyltransferase family protein, partial [Gemmatimonadetes bacterium]|nr:nucleotidyltransferase family protein [Gemmatimonadota bacterium]
RPRDEGDVEEPNAPFVHELDWELLFRIACAEQAVGVVQAAIRDADLDGIPEAEELAFRRLGSVAAFRQARLQDRIIETGDLLADLPFVFLKGASLALTHYRSIDDRPMCDIDVLVRSEHAEIARERLLRHGWETDRETARRFRSHHHLAPLTDPDRIGIKLEIHTRLFRDSAPFTLTPDDVLTDSTRCTRASSSLPVPSPEHQLLHCCLNFAWSNLMVRNGWLALRDVNQLVSGGIDWERFVSQAAGCLGTTCAYWTLRLAEDLTETPIPSHVLPVLGPVVPRRLEHAVARHLAGRFLVGVPDSYAAVHKLSWVLAIQPARSGHGRRRPWRPASAWQSLRRLPGRLYRFGAWTRYARSLFSIPQVRDESM